MLWLVLQGLLAAAAQPSSPPPKHVHCKLDEFFLPYFVDGQRVCRECSPGTHTPKQHIVDDAQGKDGWTALCLAARCGSVPVTTRLLQAGASPAHKMPSGKSARDIALVNQKTADIALRMMSYSSLSSPQF